MPPENILLNLLGENVLWLTLAFILVVVVLKGVKIVPQSDKFVIECSGRLRTVQGPGINLIVPIFDRGAPKISILGRQLPKAEQDAITADNMLLKVEISVFYRMTEPEKTVCRIRDVDATIATTVKGDRAVRNRQDRAGSGAVQPLGPDRQGPRTG